MGSLFFYLTLTVVLMQLCKDNGNIKGRKRNVFIAYTLFFIVAGIRYGIGNDYAGYAPGCIYYASFFNRGGTLLQGLKFFNDDVETAHIFLCWIFRWMRYPFVGLYFSYSFIHAGLLYLILRRNNDHYWGLFLFIIGEFMFCSWDAIRQFTAILIVVYSYEFVNSSKKLDILKFLACIGVAWLFHHSAIFTIPVYLLKFIKVNRWILIGVLGTVTILTVLGIIQQYQNQVSLYFDYFDEYSGYGSNASYTVVATSFQYKIRLLFVGIIYIFILYFYPKGKPLYETLLTVGVSIFLFANNGLTLMRISWYFWMVAVIMVGPSFNEMMKRNASWLKMTLIVIMLAIFSHDVLTGSNTRGCAEYQTIITGDLDHLPIRN